MARQRITVAHNDRGWGVHVDGQHASQHRSQEQAIEAAQQAAGLRPSEVTVQGRDGRFRTGWTYGGTDPYPPRG